MYYNIILEAEKMIYCEDRDVSRIYEPVEYMNEIQFLSLLNMCRMINKYIES